MYSGVTGEDPHSAGATSTDTATAATQDSTASTADANATHAAAETAHSDYSGPPPEPEATEYQPPAYAHAGANGTTASEATGGEPSTPQPSPVKSQYAHDDDDPPRKPGDFITHTHERGI
jgi:hypothetical protein